MCESLFPRPLPRNARLWHGKRVGIFGGSFHPPHEGHRLIATEALNHFDLDAVWWMVSPKNPIKSTSGHQDFQQRLAITTKFVHHPRMVVTDIEARLSTPYSYKTVLALKRLFPKTEFIWIAGMDNAVLFHRWNDWKKLSKLIPFVFFNRPPGMMKINNNRLRMQRTLGHRTDIRTAQEIEDKTVFWMYKGRSKNISSTEIRIKQSVNG